MGPEDEEEEEDENERRVRSGSICGYSFDSTALTGHGSNGVLGC
jgi:hypothetical protein